MRSECVECYDYVERAGEEGEKRFVFMMYFCTGKVTEIFRLEGIVRTH